MVYSFEFSMKSFLYYQSGCETEEEASSKLERFAMNHCKNETQAYGKVYFVNKARSQVLINYEIKLSDGVVNMQEIK